MILLAYRHGLRASELCDLQWHQVEINTGRLHVRRSKKGTPSVHPMQGDEIRALRQATPGRPVCASLPNSLESILGQCSASAALSTA
jgi:integrase